MRWRKLGRIFSAQDQTSLLWARSHAYLPTPLDRGDGTIRIYCSFLDENKVGRVGYVDVDAENPTRVIGYSKRPVLDIGQAGCFDEYGVNPTSVVRDGDAIRLYYQGWQRLESAPYMVQCGLAISADGGESFVRHTTSPVLHANPAEPHLRSAGFVIRRPDDWAIWYNCTVKWLEHNGRQIPWYQIRHLSSADGINWAEEGKVCLEPFDDDVYGISRPFITCTDGRYSMWFSYRRLSNTYRLGYAESTDGLHWQYMDSAELPQPADDGWDSEMVCFGAPVQANAKKYLFYNGNNYGQTGVGVAILET